jgi:hypothetical protein
LEYKSPQISINREVFAQIARYNSVLRVEYLIVSNGLSYLREIPDYFTITQDRPLPST